MLSTCKLHLNGKEKGIMDQSHYRKIPKIRPGAYIFEGFILRRGLYSEGGREMRVSKSIELPLYMEVNLLFFVCFTLYLRAIFQVQAPGGLIFGGAYTWRGLFSEFCGNLIMLAWVTFHPLFLRINAKSRAKSIIFTTLLKVTNENFSFQLSFVICNVKISKFQVNEDSSI